MLMRVSSSPVGKIIIAFIAIIFIAGISLTSILALLPQKVAVPDFAGMNVNEATSLARNSGLKLKTITASSADYSSGQVISQKPAAGQKVSTGTTIEVEVNR
jgi:beta-lactam-binding protein with PASTA domain